MTLPNEAEVEAAATLYEKNTDDFAFDKVTDFKSGVKWAIGRLTAAAEVRAGSEAAQQIILCDYCDNEPGWNFCGWCSRELLDGDGEPIKRSETAPEGWKLVPIEPTREMNMAAEAKYKKDNFGQWTAFATMYEAMLAAAPPAPANAANNKEPKVTLLIDGQRVEIGGQLKKEFLRCFPPAVAHSHTVDVLVKAANDVCATVTPAYQGTVAKRALDSLAAALDAHTVAPDLTPDPRVEGLVKALITISNLPRERWSEAYDISRAALSAYQTKGEG